jgi:hypothetical protein
MAKPKLSGTFSTENRIFDDLEKYLEFCQDFGYKYDESTLYDMRSFVFRQYQKHASGKQAKYCWEEAIIR